MSANMQNTNTHTQAAATGPVRPQSQRRGAALGVRQAPNRRDRRKARLAPHVSDTAAPRTCTKLSVLPPTGPRAGAEPYQLVETMVRHLVAQGIRLEGAHTLADVSAAFSALKRRGPAPKGPRLVKRTSGRIYVVDGTGRKAHREATPFRATPGEDWRRHLGARVYLAAYVERKVQTILRSPWRDTPHRPDVNETVRLKKVRNGR